MTLPTAIQLIGLLVVVAGCLVLFGVGGGLISFGGVLTLLGHVAERD